MDIDIAEPVVYVLANEDRSFVHVGATWTLHSTIFNIRRNPSEYFSCDYGYLKVVYIQRFDTYSEAKIYRSYLAVAMRLFKRIIIGIHNPKWRDLLPNEDIM